MRTAVLLLVAASAWCQQQPARFPAASFGGRNVVELSVLSTDDRMHAYEKLVALSPDDLQATSGLVTTYLQKLRESADYHYLDLAARLVDRMLEKDGGSLLALRFQNEIDLQRHDFRAVAERAQDMTQYAPSDPGAWGNLGDALMELGEYERAGQAYLKMFTLRPNLASYNRLAYFRFVTGDAQAAIALMKEAVAAGDPQPEIVAWCWAELGDMYFKTGHLNDAADAYRSAIALFPRLHRALAGLGRVQGAQEHYDAAISSYLRAQSIVPLVEYAAALEDLYTVSGQTAKAREQDALIETLEKLGKAANEKTNRNLALALADHNKHLDTALNLVEAELPNRGSVYTWDAMAWVLFKSDRLDEASQASKKALQLGTPEPLFYYHSSKIAEARGEREAARTYSDHLASLNPKFDVAKTTLRNN